MTETDSIFLDSVLVCVPEMHDRRFSGRYRRRRKQIIRNPEKEAGLVAHRHIKLRYVLIAALLAMITVFVALVAGAEPEKPFIKKQNISVYELIGITEFDDLFVTHGIEKEFYIDTDMSGYSVKDHFKRHDHLNRTYTKGNTEITVDQAAFYCGMPYLYGSTISTEPDVTLINGWKAVYFETNYDTCGYIINTGEYLMCYECNAGKELLDSIVTATKFREVNGNDAG